MLFMNDFDIMRAQQQYAYHPVLGKAVDFLSQFKDQVDQNSDGWAYWRPPVQAASKLMDMIQGKTEATEANFKKGLTPIKTFYTKRGYAAGMLMPNIR